MDGVGFLGEGVMTEVSLFSLLKGDTRTPGSWFPFFSMLGDEIDNVFLDRKVSSVFWVVEGVCRLVGVDVVWVEGGVCKKIVVVALVEVDNDDWEAANGELQTFGTMFFVLVLERFGVLLTGVLPPLIFFFTALLGVVFFEPPPIVDDEQDGC